MTSIRMTPYRYSKQLIDGLAHYPKQFVDDGWQSYLTTFNFNQLSGGMRQINHQMQVEIEGTYGSFITRFHRRPHDYGVIHPVLVAAPDWPVPKREKKQLKEILTNGGLHYHGILLIPPGPTRLKGSVDQHFLDNQSYYVRDRVLNRIDVRPFPCEDAYNVTDYALKGLKTNRLPGEDLVILPKRRVEINTRTYFGKNNLRAEG
jgi:hypothetical protein